MRDRDDPAVVAQAFTRIIHKPLARVSTRVNLSLSRLRSTWAGAILLVDTPRAWIAALGPTSGETRPPCGRRSQEVIGTLGG